MQLRLRIAGLLVVSALLAAGARLEPAGAQEPPSENAVGAQRALTGQNARETFRALNAIRVDRSQIYYVRDVHLRKDALRFSFTEGKLAFLQASEGRITGAVFTGNGRVIAVPREGVERRSLAWFLGAPLLDQSIERVFLRFTDNTAEELLKQLRAAETPTIQDASFADDWDVVVTNLNASHSIRILIERLSAEPRPYFYAGMTGPAIGTFEAIVDDRREEQVLIGQPKWNEGIQSYDVWASFARAPAGARQEPRAGSRAPSGFAPVSFTISTSILPDLKLEGQATLRIKARQAGERMIPLELSRYLRVQTVTNAQGHALEFFQNETLIREEIQERGNDMLLVVLPEPTRGGEELGLNISYQGHVISDAGNNVFFVGERGSWYPNLGWREAFAAFDLTFRWPRRLTLVATGKRTEFHEEGEWRTGRWQSATPVPVAGFNLGEYASQSVESGAFKVEVYGNKQLEAALLERFQQLTVVATAGRPLSSPRSARTVVVMPQPPPSPSMLLGSLAQDIADSIRFFEQYHGPFPFPALAVSPLPAGIGQGWPGLLYLSTLTFLPPAAQQRAGIGSRTQEQLSDLVPFHEVAHQWWGNSVGSGSYRDYWIHEGLASYMALLYAESKHGDKSLPVWLDRFRDDLVTKQPDHEEIPDEAGPLSLGPRLRSSKMAGAYERIFYSKGPWVFHMLRMMLRDEQADEGRDARGKGPALKKPQAEQAKDPDARFKQLLRDLLETYRHKPLSTDDLQQAVEKVMTPAMDLERTGSMEWFFDQWVRNTGIPHYSVTFDVRPQGERFIVRGKLKQSGVPERFTAAVPIYAPRAGGKPVLLGTVIADGAETSFQFTTRTAPRRLLIDPNRTLLCVTE